MHKSLDIEYVRNQFPTFQHPKTKDIAFFENAGGTYVPKLVIDKLTDFMTTKKVQPYGDFSPSIEAGEEMDNSVNQIAELLNIIKDVRRRMSQVTESEEKGGVIEIEKILADRLNVDNDNDEDDEKAGEI